MLPPMLVRRLVLAPVVIALSLGLIAGSPLLFVLALLFGLAGLLRAGRMRNLRLVSFVVVWLTAEIVALILLFGLWIVSGFGGRLHTEAYQRRNYAVVKWFLDAVYRGAERTYGLHIVTDEPEPTGEELAARATRPVIVLSRHAGPGRLIPARAAAAERVRPAAAGGDEGDPAVRPDRGRDGQPAAQRVGAAAPQQRGTVPHRADRAASPRARCERRAGHLPGGGQLDPQPVAARDPAAGAGRPRGPGRAGPAHAQPAAAPARRHGGGHHGPAGRGRDLRGARRAGDHLVRRRRVPPVPGRPGDPGHLVAGAVRGGAAGRDVR